MHKAHAQPPTRGPVRREPGARVGCQGGERPGLGVTHRRARARGERVRAQRAAGRCEVSVGSRLRVAVGI
eukprot:3429330-Prymnesium_polylepis.1